MSVETIGVFIGIAAALAVAWPIVRSKQTVSTIDLLRSELAIEKTAREDQERRCIAQVSEIERRYAKEIGELRGQIGALTPQFAKTLAELLREEGVGA